MSHGKRRLSVNSLHNYLCSEVSKQQTTKFTSAKFKKSILSKLYHTENSKTRGQTV